MENAVALALRIRNHAPHFHIRLAMKRTLFRLLLSFSSMLE